MNICKTINKRYNTVNALQRIKNQRYSRKLQRDFKTRTIMKTLYKQIPEWENSNNYKEVMIDINDSNPNTLKVNLEKRFIKI